MSSKLENTFLLPFEADEFFHSFVHLELIHCLKHRLLSPACHRLLENTGGGCYNLDFPLAFQGTPLATATGFAWGSKLCPPTCSHPKTTERQTTKDPHSFFNSYVRVNWITPRNASVSPLWTSWIITLDEMPTLTLILRRGNCTSKCSQYLKVGLVLWLFFFALSSVYCYPVLGFLQQQKRGNRSSNIK